MSGENENPVVTCKEPCRTILTKVVETAGELAIALAGVATNTDGGLEPSLTTGVKLLIGETNG